MAQEIYIVFNLKEFSGAAYNSLTDTAKALGLHRTTVSKALGDKGYCYHDRIVAIMALHHKSSQGGFRSGSNNFNNDQ